MVWVPYGLRLVGFRGRSCPRALLLFLPFFRAFSSLTPKVALRRLQRSSFSSPDTRQNADLLQEEGLAGVRACSRPHGSPSAAPGPSSPACRPPRRPEQGSRGGPERRSPACAREPQVGAARLCCSCPSQNRRLLVPRWWSRQAAARPQERPLQLPPKPKPQPQQSSPCRAALLRLANRAAAAAAALPAPAADALPADAAPHPKAAAPRGRAAKQIQSSLPLLLPAGARAAAAAPAALPPTRQAAPFTLASHAHRAAACMQY